MADVSVVVVTWQALALTQRCLAALDGQSVPGASVEVVVVDNASSDGTAEALGRTPGIRLVRLDRNLGFAGGAEAGIAASSGDVIALLNNDAVPAPGWLAALVEPLRRPGARVGATTGRVVLSGRFRPAAPDNSHALVGLDGRRWERSPDGEELLNSTGNEVTRSGNGRDRDWLRPATSDPSPREVFGFNGGCAALSRVALDDVGGFETTLFLYYEDTELSWRLRRRGWGIEHVHGATTYHDHAASSGTSSRLFQDQNERNRLLVALIHAPSSVVLRAVVRSVGRAVSGPDRGRRLRVLLQVVRRAPWALGRRRATDRTATVSRRTVAARLVGDGQTP
ncbi:glycosyltransferase family 2 protein [Actinotalea sp. M2MS4P-6]|uniref:glycosyltransferase family 2 protein n=1 Tax=Actinotalea sp. M2MS4P-6 TaxID=2983762 RepID=UPI0021E4D3B7|nr:glycosyltransferase family 2 protein [Actinotalea sp. M2MS4P-6]MCV2394177.1 glycosyltransferase family 2 protein [Actinotalea sp. M2MS4P-6]